MWSRTQLKDRARQTFKRNYWKVVLVSAIILFIGGSGTASSSLTSFSEGFETGYEGTSDYYEDDLGGVDDYYNEDNDYIEDDIFGENESPEYVFDLDTEDTAAIVTGVVVFLIVFMVVFVIALIIAFIFSAFIFNPIDVGCKRFFFKNLNEKANVKEIAFAFDNNYMNVVKTLFFRDLYVTLWSFLFIIPGIVKSYEYRMIPYLLAENPSMSKEQAFALSKQMMDGQKWKTFVLDLSFFGWEFLSLFTMGLLSIFYVTPYKNMTNAALYESLCYQRQWTGNYPSGQVSYAQSYTENVIANTVQTEAPIADAFTTDTTNNNNSDME